MNQGNQQSEQPRQASVVDLAKAGASMLHGTADLVQALINAGVDLGQEGGNNLVDLLQKAAKKAEEATVGK